MNRWDEARNILCVRLDTLGDVLMTTPALRALKRAVPGRSVTLLTSPAGIEVAPYVAEIDDVIVYAAPWMKSGREASADRDFELVARLAARAFDAAVIFTVYTQSPLPAALTCFLAGIPLRAAHCRENPYHLLTDWVPEQEPERGVRHEVRRQLDLVATLGARTDDERIRLRVPDGARDRVREMLRASGLADGSPWVVLHPGASAPSRRYRPEGFADVARILVRDHGIQVVFTGDAAEAELVRGIRAAMDARSHSLAGRLDLAELGALLESAPLLIANNTGPVHVAAAVGTPVVDLYALTNPQHTPWAVPCRVLFCDVPCRWCYKSVCPKGHQRCLNGVAPETIVAAARDLLREARS